MKGEEKVGKSMVDGREGGRGRRRGGKREREGSVRKGWQGKRLGREVEG